MRLKKGEKKVRRKSGHVANELAKLLIVTRLSFQPTRGGKQMTKLKIHTVATSSLALLGDMI